MPEQSRRQPEAEILHATFGCALLDCPPLCRLPRRLVGRRIVLTRTARRQLAEELPEPAAAAAWELI